MSHGPDLPQRRRSEPTGSSSRRSTFLRAAYFGVVLLTPALSHPGTTAAPGTRIASPGVVVSLLDTTELSSRQMTRLRDEVDRIYASCGVRIVWCETTAALQPSCCARAYVLERLPGALRLRLETFRHRRPLAWMGRHPGVSEANVYLSRAAVSLELRTVPLDARKKLLPIALARVLAHELAHVFLGDPHTRDGILKGRMDSSELICPGVAHLFFTAAQKRQIQSFITRSRMAIMEHLPAQEGLSSPGVLPATEASRTQAVKKP